MERRVGVLCHISSLPGKFGIGGLGKEAFEFAKLLKKNGVTVWQILPLSETGVYDSPYQSVCTDSGNPYFIDLEELFKEGLLTAKELKALKKRYRNCRASCDYASLFEERISTLRTAFSRFRFDGEEFTAFVVNGVAEDYALFHAAKSENPAPFWEWEEGIKRRDPASLAALKARKREEYLFWQFVQFEFFRQFKKFKESCAQIGIMLLGDLPLYPAQDSADVWKEPCCYRLDESLRPEKVAGVPPDYFSGTGQLWGNPVYDFSGTGEKSLSHLEGRIRAALNRYDLVRLDHFRGYESFYEIPAGADTAREGQFQKGPGEKLFERLTAAERGRLIAEDLGIVDENVVRLREKFGFPGMKVLLFAFDGDPENCFLPHLAKPDCVVYSGTHDNDTVAGYVKSLSSEEFILLRSRVAAELKRIGADEKLSDKAETFARAFLALALASKAELCVFPIQDVLGLDNSCRMNYPGIKEGNWRFRLVKLPSADLCRLNKLIKKYRR